MALPENRFCINGAVPSNVNFKCLKFGGLILIRVETLLVALVLIVVVMLNTFHLLVVKLQQLVLACCITSLDPPKDYVKQSLFMLLIIRLWF